MFISLGFYKRARHLSHEQFLEYWHGEHGPHVRDVPDRKRYLVKYVQHHLAYEAGAAEAAGFAFDGFSEGWFVSRDAYEQFNALPEVVKMTEHVPEFIDVERSIFTVYDDQHIIFDEE